MGQTQTSLEWLLEGFKYDLESIARPKTVKYYCGEICRFLPVGNAAFLEDLGKQIKEVLQDLRRFSHDLRPPMLDDLGLLATLRWLVSESRERCRIEVDLKVAGVERRLPPEVEFTLFRIV